MFFVVEDDPKGDPPCRYKSHHHSSLLQSASNTINPKKSNMHLLKELMEIGYLYTGVSFWIIHLPVSVAVGFPLSASFPVESKRHSSEKLKHTAAPVHTAPKKTAESRHGFFSPLLWRALY